MEPRINTDDAIPKAICVYGIQEKEFFATNGHEFSRIAKGQQASNGLPKFVLIRVHSWQNIFLKAIPVFIRG